ncbi:hypothetical protein AAMO2058_000821500 [Amorphochlora amoebiformis]
MVALSTMAAGHNTSRISKKRYLEPPEGENSDLHGLEDAFKTAKAIEIPYEVVSNPADERGSEAIGSAVVRVGEEKGREGKAKKEGERFGQVKSDSKGLTDISDAIELNSQSSHRYFMHILLYFDRAKTKERMNSYEKNLNDIIRTASDKVFYLFTVMGPQTQAYIEKNIDMTKPNMQFNIIGEDSNGDICAHQQIIRTLATRHHGYEIYFFGNDGAKPVGIHPTGEWIEDFKKVLVGDVVMAGPTISCEAMFPHVQTHFFALNGEGAKFLTQLDCGTGGIDKMYDREVELSAKILVGGKQIGSLLPQYSGAKFTVPSWANISSNLREFKGHALQPPCTSYSNPSICLRGDPSKLHFIKYGGTLETESLLPHCDFGGEGVTPHCEPSTGIFPAGSSHRACATDTDVFVV